MFHMPERRQRGSIDQTLQVQPPCAPILPYQVAATAIRIKVRLLRASLLRVE
jgi:hypothetical protein